MREVISNKSMVVWDNVLESDQFGRLMVEFSNKSFKRQHNTNWEKVWRPGDGEILRESSSMYTVNFPNDTALSELHDVMLHECEQHPEICGVRGVDWHSLILTMYIYPAGSRLSWHGDGGDYTAAMTFYCHPRWSPHWGGELLVANTPPTDMMPKVDYEVNPSIDHSQLDAFISAFGVGHMIVPKPNRLVLMKSGICHMVNRIDQAAGDHLRMSVVGFTSAIHKGQNVSVANDLVRLAA
jgi:Rps23 Pro-64 3,4-dihydroxylase Tpa1-like proline 4-hydroxylase